ncbi:hypothetical protein [Microlunatus sp. GCM10028923]|uniref:hypothetical protein n=1 Tax=Microlunatus sp. GCM10028923 TaxID=3273400 RepID=UPI00360BAA88
MQRSVLLLIASLAVAVSAAIGASPASVAICATSPVAAGELASIGYVLRPGGVRESSVVVELRVSNLHELREEALRAAERSRADGRDDWVRQREAVAGAVQDVLDDGEPTAGDSSSSSQRPRTAVSDRCAPAPSSRCTPK